MARRVDPKRSLADDTEDDQLAEIAGERLVSCLPSITHFAIILPQIYPFLLQACLVETNLNFLQHYMIFLAQNYPHEKLYESMIGISRLIIDRFDVIKKILSPLQGGPNSVVLLGSLLELFHNAMKAAIQSHSMPQLSSSADFLLVTFPKVSQKAILHTAIVQAIFLLLAQEPPHGMSSADFQYLLDLWVPVQPLSRPEVSTIEGNTKLTLPPKEVLFSTLVSENPRMLELAVASATPSELGKFMVHFGSPVIAVGKMLEVLDDLCQEHSMAAELRQSIDDPQSVAKCTKIQMLRGVDNGNTFLTFVTGLASSDSREVATSDQDYKIGTSSALLNVPKPALMDRAMSEHPFDVNQGYMQGMSVDQLEQQLLFIFDQQSIRSSLQAKSGMKGMLSVLEFCTDGKTSSQQGYLTCLVTALHQLLSGSSIRSMHFLEGMIKEKFSLTLLRMLVKLQQRGKLGGKLAAKVEDIIRSICQLLESSVHKVDKLKLYLSFVSCLKICCEKFKVKYHLVSEGSREAMSRACHDVRVRKDPLEFEASLVTLCHDLTQSSSLQYLEFLTNTLVRRSIVMNQEVKCVKVLLSIRKVISRNSAPIACQHSPGLFSATGGKLERMGRLDISFSRCSPDVTGLLVDVFELLDPEIFSLCPETAAMFLFSGSESPLVLSSSNLLLSGQGYLLARLVNNSSWSCLLGTLIHMLDKSIVQQW